jgi:Ribonuclease G/E
VDKTLPYIFKSVRKVDGSGLIIESTELTVQAKELSEAKEVFDKLWNRKVEG